MGMVMVMVMMMMMGWLRWWFGRCWMGTWAMYQIGKIHVFTATSPVSQWGFATGRKNGQARGRGVENRAAAASGCTSRSPSQPAVLVLHRRSPPGSNADSTTGGDADVMLTKAKVGKVGRHNDIGC